MWSVCPNETSVGDDRVQFHLIRVHCVTGGPVLVERPCAPWILAPVCLRTTEDGPTARGVITHPKLLGVCTLRYCNVKGSE